MDGWNTSYLFPFGMGWPIVFLALDVSFREGIMKMRKLIQKSWEGLGHSNFLRPTKKHRMSLSPYINFAKDGIEGKRNKYILITYKTVYYILTYKYICTYVPPNVTANICL